MRGGSVVKQPEAAAEHHGHDLDMQLMRPRPSSVVLRRCAIDRSRRAEKSQSICSASRSIGSALWSDCSSFAIDVQTVAIKVQSIVIEMQTDGADVPAVATRLHGVEGDLPDVAGS
jgi:hypothetical protein